MQMCKRNTDDPLLKVFIEQYGLHLMTLPREHVSLGNLFIRNGKIASDGGSLKNLLKPQRDLPPVRAGEIMASLTGKISNSIEYDIGAGLIENFLGALNIANISGSLHAGFKGSGTASLRFVFNESTRDSFDAISYGAIINRCTIDTTNPLIDVDFSYYLVSAVVRSPSISVIAESDSKKTIDIDVNALKAIEAKGNLSITKANTGEITFKGEKSLVYGVELYELIYNKKNNKIQLKISDDAVKLRGADSDISLMEPKPALIGGEAGDAFLDF